LSWRLLDIHLIRGSNFGGGSPDRTEEAKTAAKWLPNRAQPLQSQDRKKVQVNLKRNTHLESMIT